MESLTPITTDLIFILCLIVTLPLGIYFGLKSSRSKTYKLIFLLAVTVLLGIFFELIFLDQNLLDNPVNVRFILDIAIGTFAGIVLFIGIIYKIGQAIRFVLKNYFSGDTLVEIRMSRNVK